MKLRIYAVVLTLLVAGMSTALWKERANSAAHAARATQLSRQNAELSFQLKQTSKSAEKYEQRAVALDSQLGSAKTRTTATESKQVQLTRELHATKSQLSEREQREVALMTELATLRQKVASVSPAPSSENEEAVILPTLMVQPKRSPQPKSSESVASTVAPTQPAATPPVSTPAPSAEEIAAYNRRINELETQLTHLLTRALATPAEAKPRPVQPAAEITSHQVVRVGPRDAFVVLNYGAEKGATSGTVVSLQRAGTELARAQISDARPKFALAQVLPATLKGQLQTGDLVIFNH
ncbi:hypothetical protein [Oleiharenicola lentus]|uniref:hypothetical protein n=1 Tax=Oleiharenicola lentus TaxID=2508720 RepID=UPI003F67A31A